MKKILFFFFFLLFANNSTAINKSSNFVLGCDNQINQAYLENIHKVKIKKIELDVHNYRKWTVNSIKIITNGKRFIPDKYKKKFDVSVTVSYEDGSKCVFEGRVRHSGDANDHISLKGNSIIQSLDVSLKNGNIRGITKFKLFKPDVRGNIDDVVIQNQVLRNFGYLAPRSIKVNTRVNQTDSIMLFQEKANKELLEFNNRREGPILEGDQKFFFELVKDIPRNNLSNWSVGTPMLRNQSSKVMLSKLTNANLINRGKVHKDISLNAINKLNLIYLYWSNRFQDEKNNYFFFDYDLDNTLLSFFDPKKIVELDTYSLFLQSTNSQHALSASNRKFYWNSFENYFEPILYDANPNIDLDFSTTTSAKIRLPISEYFYQSFDELERKLLKINIKILHNKVTISGLDITREELKKKINKIEYNLKKIKNNFIKNKDKETILHNSFRQIEDIFSVFNKNLNEIDPKTFLIQQKEDGLLKCEIYLENCQKFEISNAELLNLLEGELQIKNIQYQYIGKNTDLDYLRYKNKYKSQEFKNSTIFYDDGIEIKKDLENSILEINQKKIGSRAYFIGGELKNVTIIFNGINIMESNTLKKSKFLPPNFPINSKGLTGCLSLINIKLENVSLSAKNSNCEDSINLINASGTINKVSVLNSFSDALDVDFSKLKFNMINISSAKNDCTDFSSGHYKLINLKLINCGDKGISIGEKSNVKIENINIEDSSTGIATKDSSILLLNEAVLKNTKTCVSAYNKKQEFQGGFIKIKRLKCDNYSNKFQIDDFSKVISNNKTQVNSN